MGIGRVRSIRSLRSMGSIRNFRSLMNIRNLRSAEQVSNFRYLKIFERIHLSNQSEHLPVTEKKTHVFG
jgi:hypothetical protein